MGIRGRFSSATVRLLIVLAAGCAGARRVAAETPPANGVVVFIIDDFASPDGHGQIVEQVLRQSCFGTGAVREMNVNPFINYISTLNTILDYAHQNPRVRVVVNISMETYGWGLYFFERSYLSKLHDAGVLIVAAAGNEGSPDVTYPAAFDDVVAVAAVWDGKREPYSNYGPRIVISAPGEDALGEGTSIAAPRVAGLAAYILARNPSMTTAQAMAVLKKTAGRINDDLFEQGQLGAGEISPTWAMLEADPVYQRAFWTRISAVVIGIAFVALAGAVSARRAVGRGCLAAVVGIIMAIALLAADRISVAQWGIFNGPYISAILILLAATASGVMLIKGSRVAARRRFETLAAREAAAQGRIQEIIESRRRLGEQADAGG